MGFVDTKIEEVCVRELDRFGYVISSNHKIIESGVKRVIHLIEDFSLVLVVGFLMKSVVAGIIIAAEGIVPDALSGGSGVDELVIPGIDAHVTHGGAPRGGREEHQVAHLKLGLLDGDGVGILGLGGMAQRDAIVGENILGVARAVKAARRGAAVNIGRSEILLCGGNDLVGNGVAGAELDIVCAHIAAQAVVAHGIP